MKCMKSSTKYLKIIINYALMLFLVLLCIYVLPKVLVFFMPFVVAWIIALITSPLVGFLEKRIKIKRKAGSAFVIILTLALVVGACYLIIYAIIAQMSGLITNLPRAWASVSSAVRSMSDELSRIFAKMPSGFKVRFGDFGDSLYASISEWVSDFGSSIAQSASDGVKNLPLTIIGVIMGVLASYLFVAQREELSSFMNSIISKGVMQRFNLVIGTIKTAVGGYFKAQFKIMAVVYVVLFAGFLILNIEYSFLVALLIAFLDFLPFFGTGTVMIPWAVIGFTQHNYKLAVGMLIVWGASQLVRQLIQPKVLGDTVGMPPIPTLFLLYIGFRLGGAVGLIIAVPIGMIVYNLYKAGVFSNFIYSTRILLRDLKRLRVYTDEELESEGISKSTTGAGEIVEEIE